MAPTPPAPARAPKPPTGARELSEYFAPQRTSTEALPDPQVFIENLTRGVLEVFAGVREVEHHEVSVGLDRLGQRRVLAIAVAPRRGVGARPAPPPLRAAAAPT